MSVDPFGRRLTMAPHLDYPCITKLEKCSYNAIKKSIFLKSQELGLGTTSPVPYDTAWVARIPETNNLSTPAFPEGLQWLRDHQREDGSWGEEHPSFLHSKILNTFAAALALSQWNYPEDEDRVKKAIEALTILASTLPKIETREKAFEMIISGLVFDARELKLNISDELFEWHSKIGAKRLKEVETKLISNKPNKYWTLLEATSRTLDFELECFRAEITQYGLIAAQPSTTAYILRSARLRGKDFPEAEWALEKLCVQNEGGVPHFSPCDNFEIIYGLDFLYKADINPRVNLKYSFTKKALNVLKERLGSKSEIGFSSSWPIPDDGCSETASRVLSQSPCGKQELESSKITNGFGFTTDSQFLSNSESLKNHTSLPSSRVLNQSACGKQELGSSKITNGFGFTADSQFLSNSESLMNHTSTPSSRVLSQSPCGKQELESSKITNGFGFTTDSQFLSNSESLKNHTSLPSSRVLNQSACRKQALESSKITNGFGFTADSQFLSNSELSMNHTSLPKTNDSQKPSINAKQNGLLKIDNYVNHSFLSGVRNVSVYHSILQEFFAPQLYDAETESRIIQFIGENQNNDGGWGDLETSTVEETAYVCLAIFRLVKQNSTVLGCVNFPKLVDFMNSVKTCQRNEGFWCHKVIFHPALVSEIAITAAKHAIFQIQRLHAMTAAFNDNRLDFLDVELFDINDQPLFQGRFLLSFPEVRRDEIEVDKQEVTNICNGFYAVEFPSNHVNALIDHCLEMTYLIHPVFMPPYERAIETSLMVFLYLVDDIFDFFLHERNNLLREVNELLSIICKILRGDYPNIEAVPALAFPRFPMLARGCFHYWKMMEKKNWNAETLVKLMEKHIFKAYADDYKMKCLGVEQTSKMYLHLHKNDSGIDEVIHQNSRLHDSSTDSTEFLNCALFVKYKDHCRKATRIISDVASVLKDVSESRLDNYCLTLQEDYKISLREALARATSKGNKEVLKMYSLKRMILKDPVYGTNTRLLLHMQLMENLLFGGLIWSTETPRYLKKVSAERLRYTEKDLKYIWDLCFKLNE